MWIPPSPSHPVNSSVRPHRRDLVRLGFGGSYVRSRDGHLGAPRDDQVSGLVRCAAQPMSPTGWVGKKRITRAPPAPFFPRSWRVDDGAGGAAAPLRNGRGAAVCGSRGRGADMETDGHRGSDEDRGECPTSLLLVLCAQHTSYGRGERRPARIVSRVRQHQSAPCRGHWMR